MNTEEFRRKGCEMIDYIAEFQKSIALRRVTPTVQPGDVRKLLPRNAPQKGEKWDDIIKDIEEIIVPGSVHWKHPHFFAYFPAGCSFPSVLAGMLSNLTGGSVSSWSSNPAATDLEMIVLDWYAKWLGLPQKFMRFSDESKGGGVIQNSTSECTLVNMMSARHLAIQKLKLMNPNDSEGVLLSRLVAYCSEESHSSVEKAAIIALVKMRILETDERFCLRSKILEYAFEEDKKKGLIPFFAIANFGSTSCCACDPLHELGPLCDKYDVWLHVDAAYAGSSLICKEFRYLIKGINYAKSITVNPGKWFLINIDCALMWIEDRRLLTDALVPGSFEVSDFSKEFDFCHWGIPNSRRFRALKIWLVLRYYGKEGMQRYIRNHVGLAKEFENHIRLDGRFDIVNEVNFGLVCFRLKGSNMLNKELLSNLNASGKLHMTASSGKGLYFTRFAVCMQNAISADIMYAVKLVTDFADELLCLH
ncbi:tyrosine decarboxylase-like [Uloborus diversus]|uniref:tyrosine decarboxylase-like n=1 Tax=Uloborus diversus TaxID=327109 RepID=UPI00240A00E5|nr:tyrosine decarboxylase-like [Uloborus diversus]